jgi:hypothetical protein
VTHGAPDRAGLAAIALGLVVTVWLYCFAGCGRPPRPASPVPRNVELRPFPRR